MLFSLFFLQVLRACSIVFVARSVCMILLYVGIFYTRIHSVSKVLSGRAGYSLSSLTTYISDIRISDYFCCVQIWCGTKFCARVLLQYQRTHILIKYKFIKTERPRQLEYSPEEYPRPLTLCMCVCVYVVQAYTCRGRLHWRA